MNVFQSYRYRHLLQIELLYYVKVFVLLLLSLDGLHEQVMAEPERMTACSTRAFIPTVCRCGNYSVDCSAKNLRYVPIHISETVQNLYLSVNVIQEIKEDDFIGLENITILRLNENMITRIHPMAFRNLFRLTNLTLDNNRLGELDPFRLTFQHLPSLKYLSLTNSGITKVNKDTFFSMVFPNKTIIVNMKPNSIKCDCDVVALNTWQSSNGRIIVLMNGICGEQRKWSFLFGNGNDLSSCNDSSWKIYTEAHKDKNVLNTGEKSVYGRNLLMKTKDDGRKTQDRNKKIVMVEKRSDRKAMENISSQINDKNKSENEVVGQNGKNSKMNTKIDKIAQQEKRNKRKETKADTDKNDNGKNCYFKNKKSTEKLHTTVEVIVEDTKKGKDTRKYNKVQSRGERDLSEEQPESQAGQDEKDQDDNSNEHDKIEYDASQNIISQTTMCPSCKNERTNHGCLTKESMQCSGPQRVCHKSVEWDASNKKMMISSSCDDYQACLTNEANNSKTCGLNYQTNKDVSCHFCCLGPTCNNNTIEGRTKDFTFYLRYKTDGIFIDTRERDERFRNFIQSLKGDFDIFSPEFVREPGHPNEVLLRLEITTFNTEKEESLKNYIIRDIEQSIETPGSYFYEENIILDSLIITSLKKEKCLESVSYSVDKGSIEWDESTLGTYTKQCPYDLLNSEKSKAARTCWQTLNGYMDWDEVDYSSCSSLSEETFALNISSENAQTVSNYLRIYTENIITVGNLNSMVNQLDVLVNETFLHQADVVTNVVNSVSNLINIDQSQLQQSGQRTQIFQRLLTIIDNVSERAPLTDGKLVVVTPNLTVAAQEVNTSETRDVQLTANSDFIGGLNDSLVDVGFYNKSEKQLRGSTRIVIPTKEIFAHVTPMNNTRLCFIVHQSDKLFIQSMKNSESSGTPETKTIQQYKNEKNNNSDHQIITLINSYVISANLPGVSVQNLRENITVTLAHNNNNASNPRCVFWNANTSSGTGEWSDKGCGIVKSDSEETTCGCNHLTNFALLMDVYQSDGNLNDEHRKALSIISYVGCSISLLALLLTILTFSVFRKLRENNPSKILINLCLAMLLSNLIFVVGMQDYTFDNIASCKAVAVLLHYFLLASLTWMAVEAFYMYLALVVVFPQYFTKFILKCCLVGWGTPLVIVVLTLSINATENYGFLNSGLCWLENPAFYAAFVGPVCLILLVNCLAFALIVKRLVSMSGTKLNKSVRNNTAQRLRGAIGVVILLGLTWLFALFAIGEASVVFYYLFAIFNSLQGLFIFIFYCLRKKDAITAWKRLLPCFKEFGEETKSSSSSKAVTVTRHLVLKSDEYSKSETCTHSGNTATVASTAIDSRNSLLTSEAINFDFVQLEPSEDNQPYSNNEKEMDSLVFSSPKTKGEVDYGSQEKVKEMVKKYEQQEREIRNFDVTHL